ncbi:hypothetical protein D3C72_2394840 [compost metagenome]
MPRIKGSHNAVLSGMLAPEKLAEAIASGRANDEPVEIENEWRSTDIGRDLKRVRNVKPLWSKFGTVGCKTAVRPPHLNEHVAPEVDTVGRPD